MKKSYLNTLLIMLAMVLLVACGGSKEKIDPAEKYVNSMVNSFKTNMDMTYDVKIQLQENNQKILDEFENDKTKLDFVNESLKKTDIKFRAQYKFDPKFLANFAIEAKISYKGNQAVSFDYGLNEFNLYALSQEILPEGVVFNILPYASMVGINVDQIDFLKYGKILSEKDALSKKVDTEKYRKIVYDSVKDKLSYLGEEKVDILSEGKKKTVNTFKIAYDINNKQVVDMYVKVLETMKKDKDLKNLFDDRVEKLTAMLESDRQVQNILASAGIPLAKYDKESWEETIDEVLFALSDLKDQKIETTKGILYIDKNDEIKKSEAKMIIEGVEVELLAFVNDYSEKDDLTKKLDKNKAHNAMSFFMGGMSNIQKQIDENIQKNIIKGKAMTDFIKDVEASKLTREQKDEILDSIKTDFLGF